MVFIIEILAVRLLQALHQVGERMFGAFHQQVSPGLRSLAFGAFLVGFA
jgi:hypothetical protein